MQVLIRVVAPHFVAGLIVEKDASNAWRAVDSAPILYWIVKKHWSLAEIEPYLMKKRWGWEVLK